MKAVRDYSGQVVIVFGRDAFLPLDYGTGIESIVPMRMAVRHVGMPMSDDELNRDLRRWLRWQKTLTRLIRPTAVPMILSDSANDGIAAGTSPEYGGA